jgi:hypothetical protein
LPKQSKAVRMSQMPRFASKHSQRPNRSVRIVAVLCGLSASLFLCAITFAEGPAWKVFSNRAGWSIGYPGDWTIGSCRSCKDPSAPEVLVDFFPATDKESGWVMIEHLADKPSGMTVDTWFAEIKQTNNLNPRLKERSFMLHDLPALSVRYRNPNNGGEETETVYVMSGSRTFAIGFSGEKPGLALEQFGNYNTFLQMVKSFGIKPRLPHGTSSLSPD